MIDNKFKLGDVILIISILFLALLLLGTRWMNESTEKKIEGSYYATIKVDNSIYKTVQLTTEPQLIEVRTDRGYDILKIHNEGIEVIESDCPEKICFTFGLITKPNETIICLPLRMIIEIHGQTEIETVDDLDAVVY